MFSHQHLTTFQQQYSCLQFNFIVSVKKTLQWRTCMSNEEEELLGLCYETIISVREISLHHTYLPKYFLKMSCFVLDSLFVLYLFCIPACFLPFPSHGNLVFQWHCRVISRKLSKNLNWKLIYDHSSMLSNSNQFSCFKYNCNKKIFFV